MTAQRPRPAARQIQGAELIQFQVSRWTPTVVQTADPDPVEKPKPQDLVPRESMGAICCGQALTCVSGLSEQWIAPYPVRMNRQQGTVKWFSRDKGWGFVRLEGGEEIFVHHTDIEGDGRKTLVDDERVEFAIDRMDKGPRARNVTRLDSPAAPTGKSRQGERDNGRDGGKTGRTRHRKSATAGAPEQTVEHVNPSSQPGTLAGQLRNRLAKLFPGIGS